MRVTKYYTGLYYIQNFHNALLEFLADVNSRSRSIYAIAIPSVCRRSVCNVGAPYSGRCNFRLCFYDIW